MARSRMAGQILELAPDDLADVGENFTYNAAESSGGQEHAKLAGVYANFDTGMVTLRNDGRHDVHITGGIRSDEPIRMRGDNANMELPRKYDYEGESMGWAGDSIKYPNRDDSGGMRGAPRERTVPLSEINPLMRQQLANYYKHADKTVQNTWEMPHNMDRIQRNHEAAQARTAYWNSPEGQAENERLKATYRRNAEEARRAREARAQQSSSNPFSGGSSNPPAPVSSSRSGANADSPF